MAHARSALATSGPVMLSRLGELDTAEFRLFLQLLGDALAARRPGAAEVTTTTSDGTLRVRLVRVDGAPPVRIVTADGVLTGPEHLIDITDLSDIPDVIDSNDVNGAGPPAKVDPTRAGDDLVSVGVAG